MTSFADTNCIVVRSLLVNVTNVGTDIDWLVVITLVFVKRETIARIVNTNYGMWRAQAKITYVNFVETSFIYETFFHWYEFEFFLGLYEFVNLTPNAGYGTHKYLGSSCI